MRADLMVDLGNYNDIEEGAMLRVDVDEYKLCLMKIGGTIYAIDDTCSHDDYSLAEGILDTETKEVECYKHGAIFDVESGEPQCLPATKKVNTYDVEVVDGRIILVGVHA